MSALLLILGLVLLAVVSFDVLVTTLTLRGGGFLTNTWNGKDFGNLEQHLISLTPLILELSVSEQHFADPVLHYFHTRERSRF